MINTSNVSFQRKQASAKRNTAQKIAIPTITTIAGGAIVGKRVSNYVDKFDSFEALFHTLKKKNLKEIASQYDNNLDACKRILRGQGKIVGGLIGLGVGLLINHFIGKNKPSTPPPVETPQEPPKPQQKSVEEWSAFSLKG